MFTSTPKFSWLLRRVALLLPLLCLRLLAQAAPPHVDGVFRGGSVTYQTRGANNLEVDFRVRMALRTSGAEPAPALGQVVGTSQNFGFGTDSEGYVPVLLTVTAVGRGYFVGEFNVSHTYAAAGRFTVGINDCCRPADILNNATLPYYLITVVGVGAANDSPVSALPPVVDVAAGQAAATYPVPASDPNGDALTYSLARQEDFPPVDNPFDPFRFENPSGVSIDPRTGVVTLSTVDQPAGALLNVIVKISDGAASTLVDHLVQVGGPAPLGPVFLLPASGQAFTVAAGQALSFPVNVTAPKGVFGLQSPDLPAGARLSIALVNSGLFQSTFFWLPTAASAGPRTVTFVAQDAEGNTTSQAVTIQVTPSAPCNLAAAQPVAQPDQFATPARPLTFTPAQLLANDVDPQGRALQVVSVGKPSRGTLVTNANGTYTYTPAPGFVGQVTLPYQLQLAGPVLAAAATGHYYEFVSAPGLCWADAQQAAAARSYQGLRGYLATVTSAAEKQALAGRFPGRYWLGAADDEVEGDWRWKTGPEAGQLFWRGGASGRATGYASWSAGQPDDYKNQYRPAGEDYAQLYGNSGLWNDMDACGKGGRSDGYVVEYGGLEACVPAFYASSRITITVGSGAQNRGQATLLAEAGKSVLEALPNPSSGQFRLRMTAAAEGPAQVDVYDLQGRRVKAVFAGLLRAGEVRELAVEAPELATGMYLVRWQNGAQAQHLRIAIQK